MRSGKHIVRLLRYLLGRAGVAYPDVRVHHRPWMTSTCFSLATTRPPTREGETYVVAALGLVLHGDFGGVLEHLFSGVASRAIALEGMRISLGAGLPVMIERIMNMNTHSDPHPACLEEFSISDRHGAGIRKW